ncbi:MAG: polysaccharide deacetylase family protein [Proteobacteria bacterium]|nr:polysaccharide deacetylase family protein [Pseudomonadota bacterium]MBU1650507.1 polysaccharide deacetylase family protein [Pseudomonadota bacterium]
MSIQGGWPTQAKLAWLQQILVERFGHAFVVQRTGSDTLRLASHEANGTIFFDSLETAFCQFHSDIPCAEWDAAAEDWLPILGKPLPAPTVSQLAFPLVDKVGDNYFIHYDILGLTYWMLSRKEEVGRTDLDEHGRFPATSSHAFKYDYLERPIVDEWLHILGQVIQRQWPGIQLKQHRFSMKVSHDVDHTSRYAFCRPKQLLRRMAGDGLLRRHWGDTLRAPWIWVTTKHILHPRDPYNTFDWLMDLSDRHGLTSAFYFMTGVTDAGKDGNYDFDHPTTRYLMRRIHKRGHEIGLHPSFNTYLDPQSLMAEADKLRCAMVEEGIEQTGIGGRMHYLRWTQPITLRSWVQSGMAYDSTLSYADRPGFRCGTCHEYPAFDPVVDEQLGLRIRPLIAMECSVLADQYMALADAEMAHEKLLQLKTACKHVGGHFTLLWHNSELTTPERKELYESVVAT